MTYPTDPNPPRQTLSTSTALARTDQVVKQAKGEPFHGHSVEMTVVQTGAIPKYLAMQRNPLLDDNKTGSVKPPIASRLSRPFDAPIAEFVGKFRDRVPQRGDKSIKPERTESCTDAAKALINKVKFDHQDHRDAFMQALLDSRFTLSADTVVIQGRGSLSLFEVLAEQAFKKAMELGGNDAAYKGVLNFIAKADLPAKAVSVLVASITNVLWDKAEVDPKDKFNETADKVLGQRLDLFVDTLFRTPSPKPSDARFTAVLNAFLCPGNTGRDHDRSLSLSQAKITSLFRSPKVLEPQQIALIAETLVCGDRTMLSNWSRTTVAEIIKDLTPDECKAFAKGFAAGYAKLDRHYYESEYGVSNSVTEVLGSIKKACGGNDNYQLFVDGVRQYLHKVDSDTVPEPTARTHGRQMEVPARGDEEGRRQYLAKYGLESRFRNLIV